MTKIASAFFKSTPCRASYYRNSKEILTPSGINLSLNGRRVGSILHNKAKGLFEVAVVNRSESLFMGEFPSFRDADTYAWLSATSA